MLPFDVHLGYQTCNLWTAPISKPCKVWLQSILIWACSKKVHLMHRLCMVKMLICFINPIIILKFRLTCKCTSKAIVLCHKSQCSYSTGVWPINNVLWFYFSPLEMTSEVLVGVFAHELSTLCTCTFLYSKNLMVSIPGSKCIMLRRSNKVIVYISVGRTSNSGNLKLIYTLVGCGLDIHVLYSIILQCFFGRGGDLSLLALMVPTPTGIVFFLQPHWLLEQLFPWPKGTCSKASSPQKLKITKNHSSGEKLCIIN